MRKVFYGGFININSSPEITNFRIDSCIDLNYRILDNKIYIPFNNQKDHLPLCFKIIYFKEYECKPQNECISFYEFRDIDIEYRKKRILYSEIYEAVSLFKQITHKFKGRYLKMEYFFDEKYYDNPDLSNFLIRNVNHEIKEVITTKEKISVVFKILKKKFKRVEVVYSNKHLFIDQVVFRRY